MARGRFISKEISLDIKVEALSDDTARLLFTWLIAHLDCEGRMYGEAHIIKAQVFPRRNISVIRVEKYLKEMENLGLIHRYSANNTQRSLNFSLKLLENLQKVQYCSVPNFEKHQTGLRKDKEAPSVIPPPPDYPLPSPLPTTDGLGSGKGKLSLSLSKDKLKISISIRERFGDVKDEVRAEFIDLDQEFEGLFDDCVNWWDRQKRDLKDPKRALRNWLRKERASRNNDLPRGSSLEKKLGEIPTDADLDGEES